MHIPLNEVIMARSAGSLHVLTKILEQYHHFMLGETAFLLLKKIPPHRVLDKSAQQDNLNSVSPLFPFLVT